MKLSSLSIVLPAYNESENIIETIKESISAAQVCSLEHEIIIVDDGSKDETVSIVRSLVATNNRIRLIENEVNRGYGTTVWRGITEAKHEYVFFTDADGQFNLKELTDFTPFSKEYDAIIGYRKVRSDPFHRKLNAFGWNSLIRLLFGLKVKDIDCAFKLIKREALIDLPIMTGSAMTVAEILIRLHHRGVVFKELPVTHLPRITGDFFFPRIFLEKPKLNRKVAMAAKNAEMMSFHASIPWNRYIDPAFIPIAIIAVA